MEGEVNAKTSFKQIIQSMVGDDIGLLQGYVKSTNPLRIQISNDEKLIISSNITYVPRHLTDYTTTVSIVQSVGSSLIGSTEIDSDHSHALRSFNIYGATMTVKNALQIGETVHILSLNHGKQYYVLDRVN